MVDGIGQKPIEGVSMAYTFDKANANAPSRHKTQYFEMIGDQGHVSRWLDASTSADASAMGIAWRKSTSIQRMPSSGNCTTWRNDWTQSDDVAAQESGQGQGDDGPVLARRKKYQVLPLDASVATRAGRAAPSIAAGRNVFTYTGDRHRHLPTVMRRAPQPSYTITAEIDVPQGGAEGVMITQGGRFGGYGFYLLKGKPVFTWNLVGLKRVRWEGPDVLAPGKHTLEFDFKYDGLGFATLAFDSMSGIGRPAPARSRWTARWSRRRRWSARSR